MNSSSTAHVMPGSFLHAIRCFVATCSQWMSDARLVLAHGRDLHRVDESADFETLLERLAMKEPGGTTHVPAFVAATLLPALIHRLGRDIHAAQAAKLDDDCLECPRWRACRAWSQGTGDDNDYRSFCRNAAVIDTLPAKTVPRSGLSR